MLKFFQYKFYVREALPSYSPHFCGGLPPTPSLGELCSNLINKQLLSLKNSIYTVAWDNNKVFTSVW